ncbi:conserved hypothetical protein [Cytophaga hutchinsonii ATCC 33406]|uniref:Sulfatase-modifying factor enzyme-like domain-containing protein n=2 Tax=Cytophaga hutchinsonii TaxID=985 RepID=A0A6N4SSI2_CYTH3|nr:conserved hypothetical protein [Cytophaga hutchinsonii ATCC 33406]SFX92376.1 Formylglycine-generating enzyme, required for sulfatase activity, contains SUMF1/FGE domain [Cytophaga hutchinsonii ATCC 33406]
MQHACIFLELLKITYIHCMKRLLSLYLVLSGFLLHAQTVKELKTVASSFSEMAKIPAGSFLKHEYSFLNIQPTKQDTNLLFCIHPEATITKVTTSFYISTHEVTNAEYRQFIVWVTDSLIKNNITFDTVFYRYTTPSGKSTRISIVPDTMNRVLRDMFGYCNLNYYTHKEFISFPTTNISWHQAQAYIHWLNNRMLELLKKNHVPTTDWGKYRLPEALEWEYAAMIVEKNGDWFNQRNPDAYNIYGWLDYPLTTKEGLYKANFGLIRDLNHMVIKARWDDNYDALAPVKKYVPSLMGLYDLSGNVSEWTNTSISLDSLNKFYAGYYSNLLQTKYQHLFEELLKPAPDWKKFDAFKAESVRGRYDAQAQQYWFNEYVIRVKEMENYNRSILSRISDGMLVKGGSWDNPPVYMINTCSQVLSKNFTTPQTGFRVALTLEPAFEKLLGSYLTGQK